MPAHELPSTEASPGPEVHEFTSRARLVLDDYSSTLGSLIPNLGRSVFLRDTEGVEWEVRTVSRYRNLFGIFLETRDKNETGDRVIRWAFLSENPEATHSEMLDLSGSVEILSFFENKMEELLSPIKKAPMSRLTARQYEVLSLTAEGRSGFEVGEELGISEQTVKNHLEGVYSKLSLRSKSEAVAYFLKLKSKKTGR